MHFMKRGSPSNEVAPTYSNAWSKTKTLCLLCFFGLAFENRLTWPGFDDELATSF